MSMQNEMDPRRVLVRDKYFTLKPKPLERWLWEKGLPQATERVFWLHWEEGMRRGDWCSELSLKQVARECCITTSTVTRAYQILKGLDLLRREDPGRDPSNPFQQAILVTEVRLPRALLAKLAQAPNRPRNARASSKTTSTIAGARGDGPPNTAQPAPLLAKIGREQSASLNRKLSEAERTAFFVASRDRRTSMAFDDTTALTPEEQGRVLELLKQISTQQPAPLDPPRQRTPVSQPNDCGKPRKLSPLTAARLRKRIGESVPLTAAPEVFRQVLWSIEEGALRRFEIALAANVALKKIREGAWTRPNRMPPNWMRTAPETCSAA